MIFIQSFELGFYLGKVTDLLANYPAALRQAAHPPPSQLCHCDSVCLYLAMTAWMSCWNPCIEWEKPWICWRRNITACSIRHGSNWSDEHGAYWDSFCDFPTSFQNPVHMHIVYNHNRTWLAPLTQSASVAIHDQSGWVCSKCFARELDSRWVLTCWVVCDQVRSTHLAQTAEERVDSATLSGRGFC